MARVIFGGSQAALLCIFISAGVCAADKPQPVEACAGDNNWPPMSYQILPGSAIEGISSALLTEIFKKPSGLTISLRPWARCLFETESNSNADIAMSVFKTTEREKIFNFSTSYHSLTPSYLFSTNRYSQAPLQTLSDLAKFNVCSLHGAATPYTHLPKGKIESGANSYLSLINKIDQNHCDIVVDMGEVLSGLAILGQFPQNNTTYQVVPLPQTSAMPVYFAISKKNPRAIQLITTINHGIEAASNNGKMKAIILRYHRGTNLPMLILPPTANSAQRNTVSLIQPPPPEPIPTHMNKHINKHINTL
jgi:ABC-type amino acid transport substrate-binding protein